MKKFWFKGKEYGYGWYPITWQGWLVIAGYLVITFADIWVLSTYGSNYDATTWFFVTLFVSTGALLAICYRTGEPLKWRWGDKKK